MTSTSKSVQRTSRRKVFKGVVASTKMQKTVIVSVQRKFLHPLYKKQVIMDKKYHARDEKGICQVGDKVKIVETRPYAKTVFYRVLAVTEKAK